MNYRYQLYRSYIINVRFLAQDPNLIRTIFSLDSKFCVCNVRNKALNVQWNLSAMIMNYNLKYKQQSNETQSIVHYIRDFNKILC